MFFIRTNKDKKLIWAECLIQKNTIRGFAPIGREKVKYPKTLMVLMSAQDVEAAGLLEKKRTLQKRIENKRNMTESNTNALNILTSHGVIAGPKGAAISFFMGLLRRSAPRNDKLLIAFVLVR